MAIKNFFISIWMHASPKMKRFYSILFVIVLSLILTIAGTLVPLTTQQANQKNDEIAQLRDESISNGTLIPTIFFNNMRINLIMFIPIVGPLFGFFALFNTGTYIEAQSMVLGFPPLISFVSLAILPHFWLEYVAYAIAMAESIWLFRRLLQHRWRELKWTGVFIGISSLLLVVGALVETWLITVLS
jgi:uncharacterized membrane protein SpoIIM required for sporulation